MHQGGQYGWPNLLLMLAGGIALVTLCVSGVIVWWKRRPTGRLAAPARRDEDRLAKSVLIIAGLLGCISPLLVASMLAVAGADTWSRPSDAVPGSNKLNLSEYTNMKNNSKSTASISRLHLTPVVQALGVVFTLSAQFEDAAGQTMLDAIPSVIVQGKATQQMIITPAAPTVLPGARHR